MEILKKIKNYIIGGSILTLALTSNNPNSNSISSAQDKSNEQEIIIYKSRKKLYLYDGNRIIDSAKCAFGWGECFNPAAKEIRVDNRTPEGEYYITEKHPSKKFGYFIGISYPNKEDAKRGLEQKIITQTQYEEISKANQKRATPPQNTALGGTIGIHGEKNLGIISLGTQINWTKGCIALSDEDIKKLYNVANVGTQVKIVK
ncbi:L,D-transpeptidase [Candidatus Pacearchaeota archaeon]|nr:L,D-transpeptidase [Candidatus Pacearchaeota archaeon]